MMSDKLVTILAVIVGALLSYAATAVNERHRVRREEANRWAQLRLQAYLEYVRAAQEVVAVVRDIVLIRDDDPSAQEGRPSGRRGLEQAHSRRALATEAIRLVGTRASVDAAYKLNTAIWDLQLFARSERAWDERAWPQAYERYVRALFDFQQHARMELGVPGELPPSPRPPTWLYQPPDDSPQDAGTTEPGPLAAQPE
jgi:hypothetical protein